MTAQVLVCGQPFPPTLKVDAYRAAFEPTTGRDQIYAAIERGEIPHIRRGHRILVLTLPAARALGLDAVGEVSVEDSTPASSHPSQPTQLKVLP